MSINVENFQSHIKGPQLSEITVVQTSKEKFGKISEPSEKAKTTRYRKGLVLRGKVCRFSENPEGPQYTRTCTNFDLPGKKVENLRVTPGADNN